MAAIETSDTARIVNYTGSNLDALTPAYILTLHAADALVGVNLYVIEGIIAETSEGRAQRTYIGAETATGYQSYGDK